MDLVCFSHLRWDFVYQRPQHLMSRAADSRRVFFIEEAVYGDQEDGYTLNLNDDSVIVVKPHLNHAAEGDHLSRQKKIIADLFTAQGINKYICWYYTPMMLDLGEDLNPSAVVYDCMDELSAFKFADPKLLENEQRLFDKADIVFTGGQSLYDSKKTRHANVHCFPSSIDYKHFAKARTILTEPEDQAHIPYPRLGFFGVVDERFDIELLRDAATRMPDHQFVIIGPVVKIDPAILPTMKNIHYLGSKQYNELPQYIAGWDIALILFALNESTKFISPTKTPEYLAAGKPVISTAIADVVRPYGEQGLVHIVHSGEELEKEAKAELDKKYKAAWLANVDSMLSGNSWDNTWKQMSSLIAGVIKEKQQSEPIKKEAYV